MSSPIDRLLDTVEWRELPLPTGETELYATHEGELAFSDDVRLRCYVLSDGTRVFDAGDVERLFGEPQQGF